MKHNPPKVILEKRIKKESERKFWKVFLIEAVLFLITSLLAIGSAFQLNRLVNLKLLYLPKTSLQDFLFLFLFVLFFVLVFVSYKKAGKFKEIVYRSLFIIAIFWGGMTILNLFLPTIGSILLMGILIWLWLKMPMVWVHDLLMVLGISGAASFFGLGFSPSIVVALLFIFSVYDFIAVYKTKHMILMAKDMVEAGSIMGFIIPKEIRYFKSKISQIKTGGNFMILGGGDVVFPSLLAVSVVPSSIIRAAVIVLFSLIGAFFSYYLFVSGGKNKGAKEPIPALPPIALSAIAGYLITLFF